MLTKKDRRDIEDIFDRKFDEKFDEKFDKAFDRKNKPVIKALRKIGRDINTIINVFDHDIVHLRKRADRIEDHLHLPPLPSE